MPIGKYHIRIQNKAKHYRTRQNNTKQNITSIFEGFISLGSIEQVNAEQHTPDNYMTEHNKRV